MRESFLRPDQRNDLLERVELLVEPALHEACDCFAVLDEAECESISAHCRNTHCLGDSLDDGRRRREVRIAGTEVDDVDSARNQLALLFGDSGEGVLR